MQETHSIRPNDSLRRPLLGSNLKLLLAGTVLSLLFSRTASADWVTLHDGRHLQGVDLKKLGKNYTFTLADGQQIYFPTSELHFVEKGKASDRVKFRGRTIPFKKKVRTLVKERAAQKRKHLALIETSVRSKGPRAKKARETIESWGHTERTQSFTHALRKSRWANVREIAIDQVRAALVLAAPPRANAPKPLGSKVVPLDADSTHAALFALSRAAVTDEYERLRGHAIESLRAVAHDDTALYLAPFLGAKTPNVRVRAAKSLAAFPDRRAADHLVDTLYMSWTGFGKAFTLQGTQRAYVADYELVSGGTGFSIVEVADPVVRTMSTGVVLEVDIQRVELYARLNALEKITGQKFGKDVKRWKNWLAENPAKKP